jgi:uncharacterized FlaG/YvyC family protein
MPIGFSYGSEDKVPVAMRTNLSAVSVPAERILPSPDKKTAHKPAVKTVQAVRTREDVNTNGLMSSTGLSFDVKHGSNALTVTLSDRNSGEVLRKLVYRHGVERHSLMQSSGQNIDVVA